MEDNKKFELNDDALDSVAGGAGESGYKWNEGDEVKFKQSWRCPGCKTPGPYAVITEITSRQGSMTYGWVRYKCCGHTLHMSMGGAMQTLSELE